VVAGADAGVDAKRESAVEAAFAEAGNGVASAGDDGEVRSRPPTTAR
jgi:hypothetical protein